jgi:DNA-binding beta-propeller fold protein YncE
MAIHLPLNLRRLIGTTVCGLMAMAVTVAECGAAEPNASVLHLVKDYPLPGKATRWDYMDLDASRSRLFIAHLGDSAVVVFDTKAKKVVGSIGNIGEVHGVIAIPELGRAYATATKTNEVVAIDADSLKIVARIRTGVHPDGLAYAPEVHKVYVSDEHGKTETVVDAQSNQRIATISLGSSVGNTKYDPASKHIFVNAQDTSELIEIDPVTDKIVQRIRVPGAKGNHGLFIEPALRLAFIACEGNDKLLVMNLRTKKVVSEFAVAGRPDVLAYDAGLALLYVASESGAVYLFKVSDQRVSPVGEEKAGANAHTVAVDPATHEVYLPLKQAGKQPVLRVMRPSL